MNSLTVRFSISRASIIPAIVIVVLLATLPFVIREFMYTNVCLENRSS
jgi:hypothetical protein